MNILKAGMGAAAMRFPLSYFISKDENGCEKHLDGFNGKVHEFDCNGKKITDDLMTRVLLLECEEKAAIVSIEIAQAPPVQIEYTKEIVSEICSVPKENIWIHVTHQFGFMHRMEGHEAMYDEKMKEAAKEASLAAVKTLKNAVMGYKTGLCKVSANRNVVNPNAPGEGPFAGLNSTFETDPEMTVISFAAADSKEPIGSIISYGTKPSSLCTTGKNTGNRQINTEVPGMACKWMEKHTKAPCMFLMPAAGDQYPREFAIYYGFDPEGKWKEFDIGFDEGIKAADRLGCEMGKDAISISEKVQCNISNAPISLYEDAFDYPDKEENGMINVPLGVLILGPIAFVGFKQEMDCITGKHIKEKSPYEITIPVSFMNGDGKYFAHREAYDFNEGAGTLETKRSPFKIGAAEKFEEAALSLLNKSMK